MEHARTKTFTSSEFVRNPAAATRVVAEGWHVIITDRGEPSLALIPIADYRRLTDADRSMVELLHMPEADAFDTDFQQIRVNARGID